MPPSSLKGATQKAMRARLDSLPRTEASFIEPMECLSVSKLPEAMSGCGKLNSMVIALLG